jgi:triosephosphate isomerase
MKILGFNLKMNLLPHEIDDYIKEIKKNKLDNTIFFPSIIYIEKFNNNQITVGSQDIAFNKNGAYTGDVSIYQLKELGIKYSIVGHSERRANYYDDRYVNKKIKLCIDNDVTPLLCVGESGDENSKNETYYICIDEINKAFVGNDNLDKVILVYEPIWAIGSGKTPTNDFIDEIVSNIKKYVYNKYGVKLKVLYGGSVSDENISKLIQIDSVDGFLVGGSSLKTESIKKMIDIVGENR